MDENSSNLRPGESGDGTASDSPAQSSTKKLDLEYLLVVLTNCVSADGLVGVDCYTKAYREINRFFELMGSVFHFVAKDVRTKILILEQYLKSEQAHHFKTIQSMISYEKENNLLTKTTDPPSGSRTVLRLHRALQFIVEFLNKICSASDDEPTGRYAQEVYNSTLAKFHPWIIRKTANIAMVALPIKSVLIKETCIQDRSKFNQIVPEVVKSASILYSIVENIYKENNILDLP